MALVAPLPQVFPNHTAFCISCSVFWFFLGVLMSCPLCSSERTSLLYSEMGVPSFQNKTYPDQFTARSVVCGDISLLFCEDCGFVWNAAFDPSLLEYNEHYQNEQGYSSVFQSHLQSVCDILTPHISEEAHVAEIGCCKATFPMKLGELGCSVHGYDPAYERTDPRIIKEYHSWDSAGDQSFGKADVIILRHVLEHVKNPLQFLQTIAEANDHHSLVYLEVPVFAGSQKIVHFMTCFSSTAIIFRCLFCIRYFLSISLPERSSEVSTATFLPDSQISALQTLSVLHLTPSRIWAFHRALWNGNLSSPMVLW